MINKAGLLLKDDHAKEAQKKFELSALFQELKQLAQIAEKNAVATGKAMDCTLTQITPELDATFATMHLEQLQAAVQEYKRQHSTASDDLHEQLLIGDFKNLIVKNNHAWEIIYYESKKELVAVSLEAIPGLQTALDHLSKTSPNESELTSINKMIHAWHQRFGNYLGHGNGVQITQTLNLYLLDFFNAYLKNKSNPLVDCISFTPNTYLECGPGVF